MTAPIPTLTGQDIGAAARATGALFDRVLSASGTEFNGWVILNLLGTNGSSLGHEDLVDRVVHGLRIDVTVAVDALAGLVHSGLVTDTEGLVALTPAGTVRFGEIRDGATGISRRLYGDLPADDLVTAHRVLATVTERANTELKA
jgi:hypothetical protein